MDKHKIYKQQLNNARKKLKEQSNELNEFAFVGPLISAGARLLGRAALGVAARETARYAVKKGLGGSESTSDEPISDEQNDDEGESVSNSGGINYEEIKDWMPPDPARNVYLPNQKPSATDRTMPASEIGKSVNPYTYNRRRNPYTSE
jgi:hypothetical protein